MNTPDNVLDIGGWINYLLEKIKNIITVVFEDVVEMFKDIAFWVWDGVLDVTDFFIGVISAQFPDLGSAPSWWSSLGGDLTGLLGYLQFDVALGLIISALLIRLVLNFIPFIG